MSSAIVSDTGSLIVLETIQDGYDFIQKLYDKIIIPQQVLQEVSHYYSTPQAYLKKFRIQSLIEVREAQLSTNIPDIKRLHLGEQYAISLASDLNLELLIEEKRGKTIAKQSGLKAFGVAGQIYRTFTKNLLSDQEALVMLQEMLDKKKLNTPIYDLLVKSISQNS